MQATGGITFVDGGITITPPPLPAFFTFGGAHLTNAPQSDSTFGDWTAMNSDGTVFVAGAPNINRVYVYSRSGTSWSLQQTITGTGYFGLCVSLSSDGCNLFIGNQSGSGKIYSRANTSTTFSDVFNTTYTRADLLDISYDGSAYAYSNDGLTLRLGKKTAGVWSELTSLTIGTGNMPLMSMNTDGSRIAVGNAFATVSGNTSAGQVKILSWALSATAPTVIQTIDEPSVVTNNQFGNNLDISPDGNTLVVSSRYNGNSAKGAVYVYTWNGSQYDLQQSFIGSADGDKLGQSNALGGNVLILTKATTPHEYLVYTRSGSTWTLQQTTSLPTGFTSQSGDGTSGGFYNRTSISNDGNHFIAVEATGTSRFVYNYQGG